MLVVDDLREQFGTYSYQHLELYVPVKHESIIFQSELRSYSCNVSSMIKGHLWDSVYVWIKIRVKWNSGSLLLINWLDVPDFQVC